MDEGIGGIGGWVARRAARRPGAVALVDAATGARHTYAELHARERHGKLLERVLREQFAGQAASVSR